jgi:hypothetical protein
VTGSAPRFSLVLDIEGGDPEQVRRSVASVTGQDLAEWQLLLHGPAAEAEAAHANDPRVRALPGSGPAPERAQTALRSADGQFTAFMGAGEELAGRGVLSMVSGLVELSPDLDLVYGDEALVDEEGTPTETTRKPVWSPERLLGQPWVGRPAFVRTAQALSTCRDEDLHEAWEWDLLLRVSGGLRRVERVPEVLLHTWHRAGREVSTEAGLQAVRGHLRRSGVMGEVSAGQVEGTCQVVRAVPDDLSVTVVVPARGERGLVRGERRWYVVDTVRSVLRHAGHPRVEVVVVHSPSVGQPQLDALLALGEEVRLLPYPDPFCLPDMANLGVLSGSADVVVLMDERTEVQSDGFLTNLLGPLTDEGVGMTGPRVLASNGTLVDAGLAFHDRDEVDYAFAGVAPGEPGPAGLLTVNRECSGLGPACLALRRATFELAGGLSPRLTVAHHLDLSFKLRHLGLRRVWVPSATVYSLGSRHRAPLVPKGERTAMRDRWGAPQRDEYLPSGAAGDPGI